MYSKTCLNWTYLGPIVCVQKWQVFCLYQLKYTIFWLYLKFYLYRILFYLVWFRSFQCIHTFTVNVLLFVVTSCRGFYKMHWSTGSWIRGFYKMHWSTGSWIRGFKHYRQQSMGKLNVVGFFFSCLKWTTKSTKIRTPRLIMISQYMKINHQRKKYLRTFSHLITPQIDNTELIILFTTIFSIIHMYIYI